MTKPHVNVTSFSPQTSSTSSKKPRAYIAISTLKATKNPRHAVASRGLISNNIEKKDTPKAYCVMTSWHTDSTLRDYAIKMRPAFLNRVKLAGVSTSDLKPFPQVSSALARKSKESLEELKKVLGEEGYEELRSSVHIRRG